MPNPFLDRSWPNLGGKIAPAPNEWSDFEIFQFFWAKCQNFLKSCFSTISNAAVLLLEPDNSEKGTLYSSCGTLKIEPPSPLYPAHKLRTIKLSPLSLSRLLPRDVSRRRLGILWFFLVVAARGRPSELLFFGSAVSCSSSTSSRPKRQEFGTGKRHVEAPRIAHGVWATATFR